jgi:hypothetical protein
MFVPRSAATRQEIEYAWYSVVQEYLSNNPEKSIDDVYAEMMQSWVNTMRVPVRKKLLTAAKKRWEALMQAQSGNCDWLNNFPFTI